MGILGNNEPRTQREKKICDSIIKYTYIIEELTSFEGEGYQSSKRRLDELYQELEDICKEDRQRYDENMFYIKANIQHPKKPKKVKVGGNIAGIGGAEIEMYDRPNQ